MFYHPFPFIACINMLHPSHLICHHLCPDVLPSINFLFDVLLIHFHYMMSHHLCLNVLSFTYTFTRTCMNRCCFPWVICTWIFLMHVYMLWLMYLCVCYCIVCILNFYGSFPFIHVFSWLLLTRKHKLGQVSTSFCTSVVIASLWHFLYDLITIYFMWCFYCNHLILTLTLYVMYVIHAIIVRLRTLVGFRSWNFCGLVCMM